MSRKKRELPSCTYHKHGAYWHVRRNKWRRLGATESDALRALAELKETKAGGGMPALIEEAFPSISAGRAANTVKVYRIAANKLKDIFQELSPEQVLPKHVAQLKRAYRKTPNFGNHLLNVLRQIMAYALEEQLIDSNPAIGIRPHKVGKRDRLISTQEFAAIRAQADPRLQAIMDLWFLTGQRVVDVLRIRRSDLAEDGIYFRQQKTKARLLVKWIPELRDAVAQAKALTQRVTGLTLFVNQRGKAPDYSTIRYQWDRACKAAGVADAQIRDLRAMSLTAADAEGKNPTALAGHSGTQITRRYLRSKVVPIVEGPQNLRQSKKK